MFQYLNKAVVRIKKLKFVSFFLLAVLICQFSAVGADAAEVSAGIITAESGRTVIIPVEIHGNSGIMGFKIKVEYDASVLFSPAVHKGEITEQGLFNDSIGVSSQGQFDVLWSNTQDVSGDGTLFSLSFTVNETDIKKTVIRLSYSQPDTFNEAWNDVTLSLKDIEVNIVDDALTDNYSEEYVQGNESDSENIKSAVEIALGELNKSALGALNDDEKQVLLDRTNEILFQLGGSPESFGDFSSLDGAYRDSVKQEYINNVLSAVDGDKADSVINGALEHFGKETIDELESDEKAEFVQLVENELKQLAGDLDAFSDKLTDDEAADVIKQLHEENENAKTQGVKLPETKPKNNTAKIIIFTAVPATLIIIAAAVLYKRKKDGGKTNENNI